MILMRNTCTSDTDKEIIRNVYSYYIKNKILGRKYYDFSENIDFSSIYAQVEVADAEKDFPKVAVVIITANKYERNVLHSIYFNKTGNKIKRFDIELFPNLVEASSYGYLFEWHKYVILNLHASTTGSYTIGGSADLVRYIGTKFNLSPVIIISYGICFGVNHKSQKLGNTYLSEKIYPYFMGSKITRDELFTSDNNMFKSNWRLMHDIRGKYFDVNKHKDIFDEDTPEFEFKIGNFITGEAVVSNQEFRDFFVGVTTQQVKAGEMEAYGMYKECSFIRTPCLTIKSICDWGVAKNDSDSAVFEELNGSPPEKDELSSIKDCIQAIASSNAAKSFESLLRNNVFRQSPYSKIKDWVIREYKEPCIFLDTILEYYMDVYASQGKAIDYKDARQFVLAIINVLKDEKVLWDVGEADNMWMITK